jgi:hypothetical protein
MGFLAFCSDENIFLDNSECQMVQWIKAHGLETLMASKYYDVSMN